MHLCCYIRNPKNNRSDSGLKISSEPVRGFNLPGAETILCFPADKVLLPVRGSSFQQLSELAKQLAELV